MSTQPSLWQQQLPTRNTRAGIYRGECTGPVNKCAGEKLGGGSLYLRSRRESRREAGGDKLPSLPTPIML